MNNDDTPVLPARQPILTGDEPRTSSPGHSTATFSRDEDGASLRSSRRRRRKKPSKTDPGLVKKAEFLLHLLKNLDMLVYTEIAALYYMECSTMRFFLRAWTQQSFLSPKPDDWPLPMPVIEVQVLSVLLPAVLCVLLHVLESLSTAGELTRGYLHGGVVVDFIGQKPPTTKLTLLAFDVAILVLQCLMLAVHSERERLRRIIRSKSLRSRISSLVAGGNSSPGSRRRSGRLTPRSTLSRLADNSNSNGGASEDIEMQPLDQERSEGAAEDQVPLLSGSVPVAPSRTTYLDVMSSGNGVLGDFNVLQTMRAATPDFWGTVGHILQSVGYHVTMARFRAGGRTVGA